MKLRLLLSFLFMLIMVVVMRWKGSTLVSAISPGGILDLEFARTADRLHQLQSVWHPAHVQLNIYLDFIFILAYTWFLAMAAIQVKKKRNWTRAGNLFIAVAFLTGLLDVVENILMLLVYNDIIGTSGLTFIFYIASLKFILIAILLVYLLLSLLFVFRKRQ